MAPLLVNEEEEQQPLNTFTAPDQWQRGLRHTVMLLVPAALLAGLCYTTGVSQRHRAPGLRSSVIGLSSQPRRVTLARFLSNAALNGHYVERPTRRVNGRETYWSSQGYVLYWCEHRWLATSAAMLAEVRANGTCHFIATSPAGVDFVDATEGWSEWDREVMEFRALAGVEVLGPVAKTFHAAAQWPRCGKRFAQRARLQAEGCNNCWATSVAQVLEWRLCISAPDAFRGPAAFLSVGYLTACAETHGCRGGDPLVAMRWLAAHGVPTGGDGNNDRTCVPDFYNGISDLKRRWRGVSALACPRACTGLGYNRTLAKDLFVPEGWNESWETTAFESAATALQHAGPVVIAFDADAHFRDDYDPTSIYQPEPNAQLFEHVAIAVGFGNEYVEAVNSWGLGWGRLGRFRIHKDAVRSYVIPGETRGRFPYPLPARGVDSLVVAGFRRRAMNGRYTRMRKLMVNGDKWYLEASNNYFLYWCHLAQRYAIAGTTSMDEIRQGKVCRYWALAPPGKQVHELGSEWQELGDERRHPTLHDLTSAVRALA